MRFAKFLSIGTKEPVYIRPTGVLRVKKDPSLGHTVLDLISGLQAVDGTVLDAVRELAKAERDE